MYLVGGWQSCDPIFLQLLQVYFPSRIYIHIIHTVYSIAAQFVSESGLWPFTHINICNFFSVPEVKGIEITAAATPASNVILKVLSPPYFWNVLTNQSV